MNRMFTVCPSCKLNLALTAADLRVGQGYVRCGRCEMVFNSLLALHEEPVHAPPDAAPDAALDAPPPALPAAQQNVDVVETAGTGTFETIVLEGDGFLQTEEHVDRSTVDNQIQAIAAQIEASAHSPDIEVIDDFDPPPAEQPDDDDDAYDVDLAPQPKSHWLWGVAAALLGLVLLGQLVHRHRQALVAQATLERPLRALYGAMGITLEPNWDLSAYDVRQLGGEAMAGSSTSILLRATVHNRSSNAQPPPMIRAVLQDRFGNALSTSDIAPQDYLRTAPPARMQADQRLDAELMLEDPNRQAVGFELDACLPAANGRLHCSHTR